MVAQFRYCYKTELTKISVKPTPSRRKKKKKKKKKKKRKKKKNEAISF